jgi:secreted trypsin-like serine protease
MRRSVRAALTVLVAGAAAATFGVIQAGQASAVAHGDVVPEGSYRFAVKLTMTGIPKPDGTKRNSACSGALISSQWIITAGHCFRDANNVRVERPVADLTTAYIGRADLDGTNGVERTIVAVRQFAGGDISIAKLDKPVRGIRPISLPHSAPDVGQVVRLAGFGSETGTNPVPSTKLRTGQMTVTTINSNWIGVKALGPQSDTSACPYDSGAPYFIEGDYGRVTLVSLDSDGPSCPHALEETTSRVDIATDWIRTAIR